jgi:hypothetical protein
MTSAVSPARQHPERAIAQPSGQWLPAEVLARLIAFDRSHRTSGEGGHG